MWRQKRQPFEMTSEDKEAFRQQHPEITFLDYMRHTAEQIDREDKLVSYRLTWFLAIEGFLFLSAANTIVGAAAVPPKSDHMPYRLVLVGTSVAGILMSAMALLAVAAAMRSIDRIKDRWKKIELAKGITDDWLVRPFGDDSSHEMAQLFVYGIPATVVVGWLFLFFASFTI
jgi:hypothetical protein